MTEPAPYSYRLADVAKLTGISKGALEEGCRNKTIPHRWIGRARVMTPADIELFLEKIAVQPSDPESDREERHRRRVKARLARTSAPRRSAA